jgi:hypothetical protein
MDLKISVKDVLNVGFARVKEKRSDPIRLQMDLCFSNPKSWRNEEGEDVVLFFC